MFSLKARVSWPVIRGIPSPGQLVETRPTLLSEGGKGHLSPSSGAGRLVVPTAMAGA